MVSMAKYAAAKVAIPAELTRVYLTLMKLGVCDVPFSVLKSLYDGSSARSLDGLYELVGNAILGSFDSLGPVYGKAGQVFLSRLSEGQQSFADRLRLTRLYGDWPPLSFSEVEKILDHEIPHWRRELKVEEAPLGVASMAQVHRAYTKDGRAFVVKIIKPKSKKRLLQTLSALDQGILIFKALRLTKMAKRLVKELEEVSFSLKRELELDLEKENIDKVRERISARKTKVLRIPDTLPAFCTKNVLTIECFSGTPLMDLVTGKAKINAEQKRKLARKMLNELLIQVFEVGLFHADPHAGNLILLEDGSIGLFDWGLTGELTEGDRRHIAAILKAVLMLDIERLAKALYDMSADAGREVDMEDITKTLKKLSRLVKKRRQDGKALPMHEVLDESLKAAEKLHIAVPGGLLLMAKSLLTIEGLARGIDPKISLARVASPLLLKAARPEFRDVVAFSKKVPALTRRFLFGGGEKKSA